jgi:hypothetical protein
MVVVLVLASTAVGLALVNAVARRAWHQERRQLSKLADRLNAEARLKVLTLQALQDMRSVAGSSLVDRVQS